MITALAPAVDVRDLTVHLPSQRRFGGAPHRALHDVSLTIPTGQVTALVGSNGAGKTTLLRTLAGAIGPTAGTVTVLGSPMGGPEDSLPAGVSVVPDASYYPDRWSADDMVLMLRRMERTVDARGIGRRLRRAGIDPGTPIKSLSAGQRTRLMLAVGLGTAPSLLMLDEPFARLDPLAREDVLDELRRHQAAGEDRTILLSTHELGSLERFVDHVVLLHDGSVLLDEDLADAAERHLVATVPREPASRHEPTAPMGLLTGARRAGDVMEGLVDTEDALFLPKDSDLRRATIQDVLTFTLREAAR